MSKQDEWGPWVEHDGCGCPCVGQYVQLDLDREANVCPPWLMQIGPVSFEGVPPSSHPLGAWHWVGGPRVIRYRIRKPRALQQLRDLVENLPCDVTEVALT